MLLTALAGCSLRETVRPETYSVERGDTLYSIAQHYGVDWHELARWNDVRPPYRIEVGQRLTLDPYPPLDYGGLGGRGAARAAGDRPRVARAPQDSRSQQNAAIQASTPQLERTIEHVGRPDSTPAPGTPPQPPAPESRSSAPDTEPAVADSQDIDTASKQTPAAPTNTGGPSEDGWQWPASGSILRDYGSDRARKGIDIGGTPGAPVYAASSGRVVYRGTGLKGYGKLVIIQHDEHYLSAYGFNRRTLVEQGEDVAAGTHIADMGLGPQNKPTLHFEIRRDGQPIDPVSVLPDH